MSVARVLDLNTAFYDSFDDRELKSAGVLRRNTQRLTLEKELPFIDDSSAGHISLPGSSGGGREMRVIKAPAEMDRGFSGWSEINQTFEGRVVENSPELREFIAVISDRTCRSNPDEEVVIGYESVISSDIDLIAEGAVFFWTIGKYRKYSEGKGKIGPAVNKYELRFRRLPPISEEAIAKIKQLSKGLSYIIHGN
jgi:hypothetical protein